MFIHTDEFKAPSVEDPIAARSTRRSRNELRGDTELMNVLRAAVESMKGDDGYAAMNRIGHYIANNSSLSSKNYGYARWSDLIRATEYFEDLVGDNGQHSFRAKAKGAAARKGAEQ